MALYLLFFLSSLVLSNQTRAEDAAVFCRSFDTLPPFSFQSMTVYSADLGDSGPSHPVVVNFRAENEATVKLTRSSRTFRAPVTLKISVLGANGQYFPVCIVDDLALGGSTQSGGVILSIAAHATLEFRAEIVDFGSGGPTGDPPYVVALEVQDKPAQPRGTINLNATHLESPGPPKTCGLVNGPARPQASLENVRSETIPSLREGSIFVGYEQAGRNVYFRLDQLIDPASTIIARFLFKDEGEAPYVEVCNIDLSTIRSSDELVLATVSNPRIFKPIWRVDIIAKPGASATADQLRFTMLRDADPDRFNAPTSPGNLAGAFPLASFICQTSHQGRGSSPRSANVGFATASVLSVTIDGVPGLIGSTAHAAIRDMILQAVAVWRRGCTLCMPENMLFLKIDGELFTLREGDHFTAAALLEKVPVRRTRPRLGDPVLPDLMLGSTRVGTRTPILQYAPISKSDPLLTSLCSLPPAAASAEAMKAQSELGCAGVTGPKSSEIRLIALDHATRCGSDENIIACEPDGHDVELNAKHYVFRDEEGHPVFGQGNQAVDLLPVLIHEVGHWIGLKHSLSEESIMDGAMDNARCVDDSSVEQLRKLATGTQSPIQGLQSLRLFSDEGGNQSAR